MISATLSTAFLIVIWASLAYRLRTLRWQMHDAIQRANCATHFMIALTFLALYPPVYLFIDRFTGIPNLARLIAMALA